MDVSDEFGSYAGRLLACLGAEVIRIEVPGRPAWPASAPVARVGDENVSLFDAYVSAGKRSVALDPETDEGRRALGGLLASADVLLSDAHSVPAAALPDEGSRLVHITITPYGRGQDPKWGPVDDLLVMGAGGLLHLGGYTDSGPVGAFGGQSRFASGIFATVAALVGLIERERTGEALSADVSAQEAVAQGLEDSVPAYVLTGSIRQAQGDDVREAGSGIYRCADGYVSMLAGRLGTAVAWASLVEWLQQSEPSASVLTDPSWSEFAHRQSPEASAEFRRIFETFASRHTKQALYHEAQARQIALSPVNTVADLLGDDQLAEREFFHRFHDARLGAEVVAPGPPFRMSLTPPLSLGSAPVPGADTAAVLAELAAGIGEAGSS